VPVYVCELGTEVQPYQAAVNGYGGATDWFSSPIFSGGEQLLESLQHTIAPIQYDAATQMGLWGWVGDSLQTWLGRPVEPYTAEQLEHAARAYVEGFFNTLLTALEESLTPYDGESDVTSPARKLGEAHQSEIAERSPIQDLFKTLHKLDFKPDSIPVQRVEEMVALNNAHFFQSLNVDAKKYAYIVDVVGTTVHRIVLEKTPIAYVPEGIGEVPHIIYTGEYDYRVIYWDVHDTADDPNPPDIDTLVGNINAGRTQAFANQFIGGKILEKRRVADENASAALIETTYRMLPFGNAALEFSDGNHFAGGISLVGDLALFSGLGLVGKVGNAAKAYRAASLGAGVVITGYYSYKAGNAYSKKEYIAGTGYVGMGFLQLLGVGADTLALLKANQTGAIARAAGQVDNVPTIGAPRAGGILPDLPAGYHYRTVGGRSVVVRNPGRAADLPQMHLEGSRLVPGPTPRSTGGYWDWTNVRQRLGNFGWAEAGQDVHHWLIPRNSWGRNIPDVVKNRKWNLMRMPSRSEHFRVHGWSFDGQPGFNLSTRLWRGTPTPAKLSIGGGVIVVGAGYYYLTE
jgi:hypothetical protein